MSFLPPVNTSLCKPLTVRMNLNSHLNGARQSRMSINFLLNRDDQARTNPSAQTIEIRKSASITTPTSTPPAVTYTAPLTIPHLDSGYGTPVDEALRPQSIQETSSESGRSVGENERLSEQSVPSQRSLTLDQTFPHDSRLARAFKAYLLNLDEREFDHHVALLDRYFESRKIPASKSSVSRPSTSSEVLTAPQATVSQSSPNISDPASVDVPSLSIDNSRAIQNSFPLLSCYDGTDVESDACFCTICDT